MVGIVCRTGVEDDMCQSSTVDSGPSSCFELTTTLLCCCPTADLLITAAALLLAAVLWPNDESRAELAHYFGLLLILITHRYVYSLLCAVCRVPCALCFCCNNLCCCCLLCLCLSACPSLKLLITLDLDSAAIN